MFEYRGTLRSAQGGPLIGLAAQVLLLAALAATVGLGLAGWLVGLACGLAMDAALAYNLLRNRSERIGPAGWVTLVRATLAVGVAALAADSFGSSAQTAPAGGARGRRAGARLRRRIRRAAHRDGVDPGRALGRRGRRVPDPRARRLRRPLGRRVGAPDRRGPLRVPGRRVAGRVDARAAAAARLAKDGCGDAGHRACDRGSGRAPARPHPRRPRRRARPARRVVRPRRMVAVEPPVGARASEGSGAGAGCRWGCRTRTRPRGRLRRAHAARVPARVGRTCRARPAGPLHTSCVREAPARGRDRDRPGAGPARPRPAHPGLGGGAGDRPADRREGARLRLLHGLRPAVQSRSRTGATPTSGSRRCASRSAAPGRTWCLAGRRWRRSPRSCYRRSRCCA